MSGIRIHHRDKRDCKVEIMHPGNPATGRKPKSYFVDVDEEGDAIVSEVVWGRLLECFQALNMQPTFLMLNEVKKPPDLIINDRAGRQKRVYHQDSDGTHLVGEMGGPSVRGSRS